MSNAGTSRGRVAIVGAGPAGMACALALRKCGFEVALYERYPEIKAAGNILNLWPPPQKILKLIGVDTTDLGAPANASFRRNDGRVRAIVNLPEEVKREYGGGFIGLLRWGLYQRMIAALPEGVLHLDHHLTSFEDDGDRVVLHFEGRPSVEADILVGADGLNSEVRRELWGEQPIRHQHLHLVGGYLFLDGPPPNDTVDHARPDDAGQLLGDPSRGPARLRVVGSRGLRSGHAVHGEPACVRAGSGAALRRAAARARGRHAARAPPALGDPRPQAAAPVVAGPRHDRRRRRARHLAVRGLRRRHVDRGRLLPRRRSRADRRHAIALQSAPRCRPSRTGASRTRVA